jgi:hypothetical protein
MGRVALGSNPALIDHPALIEKWKLVVSIRFGALASDQYAAAPRPLVNRGAESA